MARLRSRTSRGYGVPRRNRVLAVPHRFLLREIPAAVSDGGRELGKPRITSLRQTATAGRQRIVPDRFEQKGTKLNRLLGLADTRAFT